MQRPLAPTREGHKSPLLEDGFTRRSAAEENGSDRDMTREPGKAKAVTGRPIAVGASLLALTLAWAVQAQEAGSVSDYRLPPPDRQTPAPVEGPVDSDHPVAVPASPEPASPEPAGSPAGSPAASPSPSPIAVPDVPAPPAPGEVSRQRSSAPAESRVAPLPLPAPAADPAPTAAPAAESPAPVGDAGRPSPAPATASAQQPASFAIWWPLLAGLVLLLAAGAFLRLRKRPAAARPIDDTQADQATGPSAPAVLTPIRNVPPEPVLRPLPTALPIAFGFAPQSLRLSFLYATLSYRLELTNLSDEAVHDLRIGGDLVSGHIALPIDQQLAPNASDLPERHGVTAIAPGETLALIGELQRPIAEILPLRAGAALMFAPLARYHVGLHRRDGATAAETFIFTLGLPGQRRRETMQPFRIDLGPRLFRPIEQRPVDAVHWLELDELRAAG